MYICAMYAATVIHLDGQVATLPCSRSGIWRYRLWHSVHVLRQSHPRRRTDEHGDVGHVCKCMPVHASLLSLCHSAASLPLCLSASLPLCLYAASAASLPLRKVRVSMGHGCLCLQISLEISVPSAVFLSLTLVLTGDGVHIKGCAVGDCC